jgi:hypothetical protein
MHTIAELVAAAIRQSKNIPVYFQRVSAVFSGVVADFDAGWTGPARPAANGAGRACNAWDNIRRGR